MPMLTPNEVSIRTGRSRRTVMRAIEAKELNARRDNRNRWQIDEVDLAQWAPIEPVKQIAQPEINAVEVLQERIRGLEELVSELRQVNADLRLDRDHWRDQAERPKKGILSRWIGNAA